MGGTVGDYVNFLLSLVSPAFFIWMFWAAARKRWRKKVVEIADEPPGTPYRVFTSRFDAVVAGEALPKLLRGPTSDRARGWCTDDDRFWHVRIAAAEALLQNNFPNPLAQRQLTDVLARHRNDWALTLLIDMSGSMRGDPITHVAAQTRWLCNRLAEHGIPVSLLGFSTMGWHGGRAAEEWRLTGRPSRPGRLCALLHMQFKDFDRPLTPAAWQAMLHPDALRENVDGEALAWAADALLLRPERHKLLLMLSDGAAVDDVTLAHNGPSYLERHLIDTINAIVQDRKILLGAIGVGFAVDRYYPTAFGVGDMNDLAPAIVDMIDQLLTTTNPSPRTVH